ncbi:hypothetical protein HDU96_008809 [Phlyctochytrium bullatum]|nr:hypothetical protein HDU96_008809 [Phlyctochytrium bullatum]
MDPKQINATTTITPTNAMTAPAILSPVTPPLTPARDPILTADHGSADTHRTFKPLSKDDHLHDNKPRSSSPTDAVMATLPAVEDARWPKPLPQGWNDAASLKTGSPNNDGSPDTHHDPTRYPPAKDPPPPPPPSPTGTSRPGLPKPTARPATLPRSGSATKPFLPPTSPIHASQRSMLDLGVPTADVALAAEPVADTRFAAHGWNADPAATGIARLMHPTASDDDTARSHPTSPRAAAALHQHYDSEDDGPRVPPDLDTTTAAPVPKPRKAPAAPLGFTLAPVGPGFPRPPPPRVRAEELLRADQRSASFSSIEALAASMAGLEVGRVRAGRTHHERTGSVDQAVLDAAAAPAGTGVEDAWVKAFLREGGGKAAGRAPRGRAHTTQAAFGGEGEEGGWGYAEEAWGAEQKGLEFAATTAAAAGMGDAAFGEDGGLDTVFAPCLPALPDPLPFRRVDQGRLRDMRKRLEATPATHPHVAHGHEHGIPMSNVMPYKELEAMFFEVLPEAVDLCTDYIGNVVIQKLIERCGDPLRLLLLNTVAPHLAAIGIHKNGTWAVQRFIDLATTSTEMDVIVAAIRPYTPPLLLDPLGNYVVQCCLRFGSPKNDFIFAAIARRCVEVGTGRFGARAIRACLESQHAARNGLKACAAAIVEEAVRLVAHPNGAILITWLLETSGLPGRYRALAPRLAPYVHAVCCHKLGSTTVLKIINQRSEVDARDLILKELFFKDDMSLASVVTDPHHGASVLYKILATGCIYMEERIRLADRLRLVILRVPLATQLAQVASTGQPGAAGSQAGSAGGAGGKEVGLTGLRKLLDEMAGIPSALGLGFSTSTSLAMSGTALGDLRKYGAAEGLSPAFQHPPSQHQQGSSEFFVQLRGSLSQSEEQLLTGTSMGAGLGGTGLPHQQQLWLPQESSGASWQPMTTTQLSGHQGGFRSPLVASQLTQGGAAGAGGSPGFPMQTFAGAHFGGSHTNFGGHRRYSSTSSIASSTSSVGPKWRGLGSPLEGVRPPATFLGGQGSLNDLSASAYMKPTEFGSPSTSAIGLQDGFGLGDAGPQRRGSYFDSFTEFGQNAHGSGFGGGLGPVSADLLTQHMQTAWRTDSVGSSSNAGHHHSGAGLLSASPVPDGQPGDDDGASDLSGTNGGLAASFGLAASGDKQQAFPPHLAVSHPHLRQRVRAFSDRIDLANSYYGLSMSLPRNAGSGGASPAHAAFGGNGGLVGAAAHAGHNHHHVRSASFDMHAGAGSASTLSAAQMDMAFLSMGTMNGSPRASQGPHSTSSLGRNRAPF